jgi:hypothetical protein
MNAQSIEHSRDIRVIMLVHLSKLHRNAISRIDFALEFQFDHAS